MIKVALVEDDRDLLEDVSFSLRDEGFSVTACSEAAILDRHLSEESFDIAVLDVGLPGEDGFSVARRLRRDYPQLGIIMLTARTSARSRVHGMEQGADVYLGKPVDLRELALVIRALARRIAAVEAPGEDALTLLIDENILCLPEGKRVELTPSEMLVLSRLARATGSQATRRQLVEAFGENFLAYDERRLEAIVSRLRRKLEAAGLPADTLRAVRGMGYALRLSVLEKAKTA
jgi:DNA-binding response OmpR family regulator